MCSSDLSEEDDNQSIDEFGLPRYRLLDYDDHQTGRSGSQQANKHHQSRKQTTRDEQRQSPRHELNPDYQQPRAEARQTDNHHPRQDPRGDQHPPRQNPKGDLQPSRQPPSQDARARNTSPARIPQILTRGNAEPTNHQVRDQNFRIEQQMQRRDLINNVNQLIAHSTLVTTVSAQPAQQATVTESRHSTAHYTVVTAADTTVPSHDNLTYSVSGHHGQYRDPIQPEPRDVLQEQQTVHNNPWTTTAPGASIPPGQQPAVTHVSEIGRAHV